jgi:hypothetical protein
VEFGDLAAGTGALGIDTASLTRQPPAMAYQPFDQDQ